MAQANYNYKRNSKSGGRQIDDLFDFRDMLRTSSTAGEQHSDRPQRPSIAITNKNKEALLNNLKEKKENMKQGHNVPLAAGAGNTLYQQNQISDNPFANPYDQFSNDMGGNIFE